MKKDVNQARLDGLTGYCHMTIIGYIKDNIKDIQAGKIDTNQALNAIYDQVNNEVTEILDKMIDFVGANLVSEQKEESNKIIDMNGNKINNDNKITDMYGNKIKSKKKDKEEE